MNFESYIRKPFEVQAVEVTRQNIKEIAELIGKIRWQNGVPHIEVDSAKVPNIGRVYLGYWVTKIGDENIRCYSNKVFKGQFAKNTDDVDAWVRFINDKPAKSVPVPEPAGAES